MTLTPTEKRKFDRSSRISLMSAELGIVTGKMADEMGLTAPEVAEVLANLQGTVARGIGKMYVPKAKRVRK